jgi:quercetin dioxygenase-like cupin family protein
MKIFQFNAHPSRAIIEYGSQNAVVAHLVRRSDQVSVVCIRLEADGVLGYHQATGDQLFLVIEGVGWVRAESTDRIPVTAGQAAFWHSGEWHETTTETGLTAIVIEGKLSPVEFQELQT